MDRRLALRYSQLFARISSIAKRSRVAQIRLVINRAIVGSMERLDNGRDTDEVSKVGAGEVPQDFPARLP